MQTSMAVDLHGWPAHSPWLLKQTRLDVMAEGSRDAGAGLHTAHMLKSVAADLHCWPAQLTCAAEADSMSMAAERRGMPGLGCMRRTGEPPRCLMGTPLMGERECPLSLAVPMMRRPPRRSPRTVWCRVKGIGGGGVSRLGRVSCS